MFFGPADPNTSSVTVVVAMIFSIQRELPLLDRILSEYRSEIAAGLATKRAAVSIIASET